VGKKNMAKKPAIQNHDAPAPRCTAPVAPATPCGWAKLKARSGGKLRFPCLGDAAKGLYQS